MTAKGFSVWLTPDSSKDQGYQKGLRYRVQSWRKPHRLFADVSRASVERIAKLGREKEMRTRAYLDGFDVSPQGEAL